jgi:hypothetical protein
VSDGNLFPFNCKNSQRDGAPESDRLQEAVGPTISPSSYRAGKYGAFPPDLIEMIKGRGKAVLLQA